MLRIFTSLSTPWNRSTERISYVGSSDHANTVNGFFPVSGEWLVRRAGHRGSEQGRRGETRRRWRTVSSRESRALIRLSIASAVGGAKDDRVDETPQRICPDHPSGLHDRLRSPARGPVQRPVLRHPYQRSCNPGRPLRPRRAGTRSGFAMMKMSSTGFPRSAASSTGTPLTFPRPETVSSEPLSVYLRAPFRLTAGGDRCRSERSTVRQYDLLRVPRSRKQPIALLPFGSST